MGEGTGKSPVTPQPVVLANAGTLESPKPVTLDTAAKEPPKLSVPVATNIKQAALKVSASETFSVGTDGQSVSQPPMEVPKGAIDGKPEVVVKAENPFSLKGKGNRVVATYVTDGDTFNFSPVGPQNIPGSSGFTCRIDSIDTPEKNFGSQKVTQAYGPEATAKLKQMIENKEVEIVVTRQSKGKGKDRNICQVEMRGAGVDHEMVKAGMAWVYREYVELGDPRRGLLLDAEGNARQNRIGLWSDPSPMNPALFRRLNQ